MARAFEIFTRWCVLLEWLEIDWRFEFGTTPMICSGAPTSLRAVCGLAALVALPIGGCISHDTPGDLAFKSIEAVDIQNWRELLGPGTGRVSLQSTKRA